MSSLLNFTQVYTVQPLPRSIYSTFPDPRGPLCTAPPQSCLPPGGCYSDFNHHGLVFPVSEIPMDGILSHVFFAYDFLSSTLPLWNSSGYHMSPLFAFFNYCIKTHCLMCCKSFYYWWTFWLFSVWSYCK